MEKKSLFRILRIASEQFNNLATGYLGVSIFAPVFTADIRPDVIIKSIVLGIGCLACVYVCEKILDESAP